MSDFIFSVNVTFPIFLVMVIGWVLHQIGMLDEHFVTVANRFNFKVTLPFMLFRDIASVEISKVFDLKFVLYYLFFQCSLMLNYLLQLSI